MPNQTVKKLNSLLKDCKGYTYKYKRQKWIVNYDIITCIKLILVETDNNKLTIEALINLEVAIENMSDEMGKSMPLVAFKVLLNTAKKACRHEIDNKVENIKYVKSYKRDKKK